MLKGKESIGRIYAGDQRTRRPKDLQTSRLEDQKQADQQTRRPCSRLENQKTENQQTSRSEVQKTRKI